VRVGNGDDDVVIVVVVVNFAVVARPLSFGCVASMVTSRPKTMMMVVLDDKDDAGVVGDAGVGIGVVVVNFGDGGARRRVANFLLSLPRWSCHHCYCFCRCCCCAVVVVFVVIVFVFVTGVVSVRVASMVASVLKTMMMVGRCVVVMLLLCCCNGYR